MKFSPKVLAYSTLTIVGAIGLVVLALLVVMKPPTTFYGMLNFLILPMVFLTLAVTGAYGLLSSLGKSGEERAKRDAALEVLRERFARGELSEEEFLRRKKLLEEQS